MVFYSIYYFLYYYNSWMFCSLTSRFS